MSAEEGADRAVRVTVVIPFLDPGRFFREAVESVLAQEGCIWELLLVDDGSRPEEGAVAREYARRDPSRVRVLEHPGHANRGRSAARNLGLAEARGEYTAFLDADDIWLPGKLARQAAVLDRHPGVPMLCGRAEWWWSWSGEPEDAEKDFVQRWSVPLDAVVPPPAVLRMYLDDEWASPCDILVRTRDARALGGWVESFGGMYDDQAFHAKICLDRPVYMSAGVGYRYRQHGESCTSRAHAAGSAWWARGVFLEWLDAYLGEPGRDRDGLRRRVRRELFRRRHLRLWKAAEALRRFAGGGARPAAGKENRS